MSYRQPSTNRKLTSTKNTGLSGTHLTSTEGKSVINITGPPSQSNVPGVGRGQSRGVRPAPPSKLRNGSGPNVNRKKTLPGGKLRPLPTNDQYVQSRYYADTWSSSSSNQKPTPSTSGSKLNRAQATPSKPTKQKPLASSPKKPSPPVSTDSPLPETPAGRESSVSIASSTKAVLPNIPKTNSVIDNEPPVKPAGPAESLVKEEPRPPAPNTPTSETTILRTASRSAVRPRTSVKERIDKEAERLAKNLDRQDMYKPDWYIDPSIRPAPIKSGHVLLCLSCLDETLLRESCDGEIELLELSFCEAAEKADLAVQRLVASSGLVMALDRETDEETKQNGELDNILPSFLTEDVARQINKILDKTLYSEVKTGLYRAELSSLLENDLLEESHGLQEKLDQAGIKFTVSARERLLKVCENHKIQIVKSFSEAQRQVAKFKNKHLNIVKQEQAIHPHVYLQPIEKEECYNHIHLAHQLAEESMERPELLEKLIEAIEKDSTKLSSPVLVEGNMKAGKSALCSMLTTARFSQPNLVINRFCGVTQLSKTLDEVLLSVSKQLHAIIGTKLIPLTRSENAAELTIEAFLSLLEEFKEVKHEQNVIIVLDGLDKLLDRERVRIFVNGCMGAVPAGLTLVLSHRTTTSDTEFLVPPVDDMRARNKKLLEEKLKEMTSDMDTVSLDGSEAGFDKSVLPGFDAIVSISEIIDDDGLLSNKFVDLNTLTDIKETLSLIKNPGDGKTAEAWREVIAVFMKKCEDWDRAATRRSLDNLTKEQLGGADCPQMYQKEGKEYLELSRQSFALLEEPVTEALQTYEAAMEMYKAAIEASELRTSEVNDMCLESSGGDLELYMTEKLSDSSRVEVTDFTQQESAKLMTTVCQDYLTEKELNSLVQLSNSIRNPLLVRLLSNWMRYKLVTITTDKVSVLAMLEELNKWSNAEDLIRAVKEGQNVDGFSSDIHEHPAIPSVVMGLLKFFDERNIMKALPHILVACCLQTRHSTSNYDTKRLMNSPLVIASYQELFMSIFSNEDNSDEDQLNFTWLRRQILRGCTLDSLYMGQQRVDCDGHMTAAELRAFYITAIDVDMESHGLSTFFMEYDFLDSFKADVRFMINETASDATQRWGEESLALPMLTSTILGYSGIYTGAPLEKLGFLGERMDNMTHAAVTLKEAEVRLDGSSAILIKTEEGASMKKGNLLEDPLFDESQDEGEMFNGEPEEEEDYDTHFDLFDDDQPTESATKKETKETKETKNTEETDEIKEKKETAETKDELVVAKPLDGILTDEIPKKQTLGMRLFLLQHVHDLWMLIASNTGRFESLEEHSKEFFKTSLAESYLIDYDLLQYVMQHYGVDYLVHQCELILGTQAQVSTSLVVSPIHSQSLELFYHFLISHLEALRVAPNAFPRLFMGAFSSDAALSNGANSDLFDRVKKEIEKGNQPHLITTLVNASNNHLISHSTKQLLNRIRERYTAAECVSNASYILSHNRQNEIKLWELTGEFITSNKLDGDIVAICPLRYNASFMAVTEEISEVGIRTAKVWMLTRSRCKKVLDIGTRHILAAWFEPTGNQLVLVEQDSPEEVQIVLIQPKRFHVQLDKNNVLTFSAGSITNFLDENLALPERINRDLYVVMSKLLKEDKNNSKDIQDLEKCYQALKSDKDGNASEYELDLQALLKDRFAQANLTSTWTEVLARNEFTDMEEITFPMRETRSDVCTVKENIHKMKKVRLHGMTSTGDIVVDFQLSSSKHHIMFFKYQTELRNPVETSNEPQATPRPTLQDDPNTSHAIVPNGDLEMNASATMTLMPSDDFVYCDVEANTGLTSWHLPSNTKKMFGNEQNEDVTCLQFEVEEGQILSFTRGKVTTWNAIKKTTESCFTLDKQHEVIAACLQDNWLLSSNRRGEMTLRFEIRKKKASYEFPAPVDWIDSHVIDGYVYAACHVLGSTPSISFLKYKVPELL